MSGPNVLAQTTENPPMPQPSLLDATSRKTGKIMFGGVFAAELIYVATNPLPEVNRVANPIILDPKNKTPEAIAHRAAVSKAKFPDASPVGNSLTTELGFGLAAVTAGVLAVNAVRRARYEIQKFKANKQKPETAQ